MTIPPGTRPTIPIAAPDVGDAEVNSVREVLTSGQLSAGETVRSFEAEFASYCEGSHGVATSNGTKALHAALVALGIGHDGVAVTDSQGDESGVEGCRPVTRRILL